MAGYEILNENGASVGPTVLSLFYGNLWKTALDRLSHQHDGHIITIFHMGQKLKVYRKIGM